MTRIRNLFPHFIRSVLNSYTQIFFSDNNKFALLLIIVTFFDPVAGLSGMLCVVLSNVMAYVIGFNRHNIKSGFYGFNSLLVGLGLGVYYQLNIEFVFLLFFASLLTLFLTVVLEGVIGKYGLPFLSISFLLGFWMLALAARNFTHLELSERGIFILNDMYRIGGLGAVRIYLWFDNLQLHESIRLYFKSLGAIFFQYHLLAGIIIAFGLLLYSRIAFLLSLVGFYAAYFFYYFIGADIGQLTDSYIGFNFILSSIAIGGFFIISSRYSFLWVLLLTPVIAVLINASTTVLGVYQLPIYSLPFNVMVLVFLYVLKFRERFFHKPELVLIQHFSPEKNLYTQVNNKERFRHAYYTAFSLPFWGEWTITQGHDGEYTHKKDWRHAWDFEIKDEDRMAFRGTGRSKEDYYCYNKPLVAPFAGWVEEIVDDIDDNEIGQINTEQNWGNTIVLKHIEGLYTKLCHIKKGSFKVSKGDYVKKGDIIAHCGNSGRSPQPHLHFQVQSTPFIGSKTLDYPLGHYILKNDGNYELRSFSKPHIDDIVTPVERDLSLFKAFHFIPGQKLAYTVYNAAGAEIKTYEWEVVADIFNNTYIWCSATRSKIYFRFDDQILYFTAFEGKKNTLLYFYYLAYYKVLLGYYKNLVITDIFPVNTVRRPLLMIVQDFTAPFVMFMKTKFSLTYTDRTSDLSESSINMKSSVEASVAGFMTRKFEFETFIRHNRIEKFTITSRDKKLEARYTEPELYPQLNAESKS
ncbi:MAG: urea transporter [Bacteroidota bacterium]